MSCICQNTSADKDGKSESETEEKNYISLTHSFTDRGKNRGFCAGKTSSASNPVSYLRQPSCSAHGLAVATAANVTSCTDTNNPAVIHLNI